MYFKELVYVIVGSEWSKIHRAGPKFGQPQEGAAAAVFRQKASDFLMETSVLLLRSAFQLTG